MTVTEGKQVIRAGVLSDTHLSKTDDHFQKLIDTCFHGCEAIIHAGDLTNLAILQAFGNRTVYCVHGNMCDHSVRGLLPGRLTFQLGAFTIGLAHGDRLGVDIEAALWNIFPEADCLIYGHTHQPACHKHGGVLFLNPGSFRATSRFGSPGTYAILEAGDQLHCSLHNLPQLQ